MPELAEVEFYRKQWNDGLKQKVLRVQMHAPKRVFRETDTETLERVLTGATLLSSHAHGKQMLFRFSQGGWLGVHLGMSGKLRAEPPNFEPRKHDHMVLHQAKRLLVFEDPRQFGRVLFHQGETPEWWSRLPPAIGSDEFTFRYFEEFLARHSKAPIKAVLLLQEGFPGVGNWMADEILWQARVHPSARVGNISAKLRQKLYQKTRYVCEQALGVIGKDFSDPPATWLFRHRWKREGNCPRCSAVLRHTEVGGRTSCWCPGCQPSVGS